MRAGLGKVHLSNLPENQALFTGTIDVAGSFGGVYETWAITYADLVVCPLGREQGNTVGILPRCGDAAAALSPPPTVT